MLKPAEKLTNNNMVINTKLYLLLLTNIVVACLSFKGFALVCVRKVSSIPLHPQSFLHQTSPTKVLSI